MFKENGPSTHSAVACRTHSICDGLVKLERPLSEDA